jgi:hypothetical protein
LIVGPASAAHGVERIEATTYDRRMLTGRTTRSRVVLVAALTMLGATLGCWRSAPHGDGDVRVTDITLGRALASDGTIAADARTSSFWANDTFYVEVATEGTAQSATLTARFTYQDGTAAGEATKTISPNGATTTVLQASPAPELWKPGDYKVEVFLDGASAGIKDLSAR